MIQISNIKLSPDYREEELYRAAAHRLKLGQSEIASVKLLKQSLDARRRPDIYYVCTLGVTLQKGSGEQKLVKRLHRPEILVAQAEKYIFPYRDGALAGISGTRPVIAGFGPAGMFAGLMLARCGLRPLIVERGECVDDRMDTVQRFWRDGTLNLQSNVQFGEGGAGTFSDGKLNTSVRDSAHRIEAVLSTFVEAGADESILYVNKPHIGTDALCSIVKHIRLEIEQLGGEVFFHTRLDNFDVRDGVICSAVLTDTISGERREIVTDTLVLALGHSARDTFAMLYDRQLTMLSKAFAVGLRVEHPQQMINDNAYGETRYSLPAADYKLTYTTKAGRGVYSFCMCPGGYVVNASSEREETVVNGMSYAARDSANANSAIIVTVTPQDCFSFIPDYKDHPLAGVEFQRMLERAAYQSGAGKIPLQLFGDYLEGKASSGFGAVQPCIKGDYTFANVRAMLPDCIGASIAEAFPSFERRIKGFCRKDAVLSGVESRTSSPLRILRDKDTFEASVSGIYPCGEGAGYAGGITSAAMDGIKTAEKVAKRYADRMLL